MTTLASSGQIIFLNGTRFLMPALTLDDYLNNYTVISEHFSPAGREQFPSLAPREYILTALPLILLAFQINYPSTTLDDLREWLGLTNFAAALAIALGTSPRPIVTPTAFLARQTESTTERE